MKHHTIDQNLEAQASALLQTMRSRKAALERQRMLLDQSIENLARRIEALSEAFEDSSGLSHGQSREDAAESVQGIPGAIEEDQLDDAILEALCERQRARVVDVIEALEERGWHGEKKSIYNRVDKLREHGQVVRLSRGVYTVAA